MFLSKFYQKRATRRAMNVPGSGPDILGNDWGNASTSANEVETVEVRAKVLNERQHWRDLPTIILTKDTGEVMILWSPSERRDGSPSEQPDRTLSAQPDMALSEQPDGSPSGPPDRSPLKQLNSSQCGQGAQDLEGKERKAIPSIHI